ncbi:deleted in malignant brain tumors 1 protein-like [Ylistrum balloti]|uniref:deleted in malignant brain tumors 1 protein-like n=1 Tax=Ylistrum balloti TaxID=509963 RepID=UPI002905E580|nr:deleted in malignant brain tumors 1 protein-like [Ylistrum balloti]
MTCSWKIFSPHPSAHILVQLKGVWIGDDDFISIYDGPLQNLSAALVYNFTDQSGSTDVKDARSGKALVVFTSGNKKQKGERGFTIFLLAITTAKPTLDCQNETLLATTSPKFLTSPGFPDGYPPNKTCFWTIQALSKRHNLYIELLFHDIEEGDEDCNYDYVKAYTKNKENSTTTTVFTKCKSNVWDNLSFNVTGKEVFLEFFSDVSETRTGFLLQYSSVRKPGTVTKPKSRTKTKEVVTEKPKQVTVSTLEPEESKIDPLVSPPVSRIDVIPLPPLSLPAIDYFLAPCGMCCTYSGVDCFQDCFLCDRQSWDILMYPDVINNFNLNLW